MLKVSAELGAAFATASQNCSTHQDDEDGTNAKSKTSCGLSSAGIIGNLDVGHDSAEVGGESAEGRTREGGG